MSRSRQTSSKREREEKKKTKRKQKEQKKEVRKSNADKDKSFESMIAYVDEKGNFSSTPPDPALREELKLEDIQLGARKHEDEAPDFVNKGKVSYFNDAKGYGFINDSRTNERVFFHVDNILEVLEVNDMVTFNKVKSVKGITATMVTKFK